MWLTKSIRLQVAMTILIWVILTLYLFARPNNWDPKLSLSFFIAIPAAVIAIAQLSVTAHIQRAAYIKDYAIRYRTDKELTESFHYLVYRFGNSLYEIYMKPADQRSPGEKTALEVAQNGLATDLCFFNPHNPVGMPQERRLDNLLGFFDTVGYDLKRGLLHESDIAGVFGFQLDHLIQRKVVQEYLKHIEQNWPNLRSFHESYNAPVPFQYLRRLQRKYIEYQNKQRKLAETQEG